MDTQTKINLLHFLNTEIDNQKFWKVCYISLYKKQNGHPKNKSLLHFSIPKPQKNRKIEKSKKHVYVTFFSIPKPTTDKFGFFCYISLYPNPQQNRTIEQIEITCICYIFSIPPRPTTQHFYFFCYISLYKKAKWTTTKTFFLLHFLNTKTETKIFIFFVTFLYTNKKMDTKNFFFVTFSQYQKLTTKIFIFFVTFLYTKTKTDNETHWFCYIFSIPKPKTQKNILLLHFAQYPNQDYTQIWVFLLHFSIQKAKRTTKKNNFVTFCSIPRPRLKNIFFCYISLYKKQNGQLQKKILLHFLYTEAKKNQNFEKQIFLLHFLNTKTETDNSLFTFLYTKPPKKPENKKNKFLLHFAQYPQTDNQNFAFFVTFPYTKNKMDKEKYFFFLTFSQYPNQPPKMIFFYYISLYKRQNGQPKKLFLLHFPNHRRNIISYIFSIPTKKLKKTMFCLVTSSQYRKWLLHFSIPKQKTEKHEKNIFFLTFSLYRDQALKNVFVLLHFSIQKTKWTTKKKIFLHFLNTKTDNQKLYFFVTFLYTKSKMDNQNYFFFLLHFLNTEKHICYVFSIPTKKQKTNVFCLVTSPLYQ